TRSSRPPRASTERAMMSTEVTSPCSIWPPGKLPGSPQHALAACTVLFRYVRDVPDQVQRVSSQRATTPICPEYGIWPGPQTETENETHAVRCTAAREHDPSASSQVSVAEDARFELARGCPQHAFQQCWPVFAGVRHRPGPART